MSLYLLQLNVFKCNGTKNINFQYNGNVWTSLDFK